MIYLIITMLCIIAILGALSFIIAEIYKSTELLSTQNNMVKGDIIDLHDKLDEILKEVKKWIIKNLLK